jgi:hypothetical protein
MSAKQFHQQPLLAGTSVAIDHKGQDDHYDKLRLSRIGLSVKVCKGLEAVSPTGRRRLECCLSWKEAQSRNAV